MNNILKYIIILLIPYHVNGQCDTVIFDTKNANIGCSSSYTIKARSGYSSYFWDNGTTRDSLVVNSPGLYWCEVIINKIGTNLIFNGDFSLGDTGFTNSYNKSTGCFGNGNYDVRSSGLNCFSGVWSINSDHTGGSPGNFLLVNESSTGTEDWCQTVSTVPGATYLFQGWFANMAWNPNFILEVNNVVIGSSGAIPNNSTWINYGFTFVATSTSSSICIKSNGSASDIGIDDLSLFEVCVDRDTFEVFPPVPLYDTIIDSICNNNSYNFRGNIITSPGTYNDTLVNAGCDSIITLILNNIYIPIAHDTIFVCDSLISPSGKYVWQTSGDYSDTLLSINGCDSVTLINLTIGNNYDTLTVFVCDSLISPSTKYVWNVSGVYYDTILTNAGCDSMLTVFLDVGKKRDTVNLSACYSLTSPSGLHSWNLSGTYYDTVTSSNGCDSLLVINLTINTSYDTISIINCDTTTSPSGKYSWVTSGTYYDTLVNQYGCDSNLVINLIISLATTDTIKTEQCGPLTSILGKSWEKSGIYYEVLSYSNGCDSIIYIYEFVNQCEGGCPLFVPNAFTPNHDGKNDILYVISGEACVYDDFEFLIFNRWGELIFSTKNIDKGWDGTNHNIQAPQGVYTWKVATSKGAKKEVIYGHVSLIK